MGSQPQFGDEFIDRVLRWSIGVGAIGGVIGWLVTTEVVTAFALWLGAAVDVATFRLLAVRGRRALQGEGELMSPAIALLARLAAKAALLVVVVLTPWPSALWGGVAGVLVVEVMLVVLGIANAVKGLVHHRPGPGQEVSP